MASKKIEDLYYTIQPKVRELIERSVFGEWRAFITDGMRTPAEQDELYAQGRTKPGKIVTNAKGGQSMHNFGLAIDVAFISPAGVPQWNELLYKKMAVIARKLGFEWGGDWIGFKDMPHFQYTGGLTLPQIQSGQRPTIAEDAEFIQKWEMRFILDTEDAGKVYFVKNGKRIYIPPEMSLKEFAMTYKLPQGFSHKDVLRIPQA